MTIHDSDSILNRGEQQANVAIAFLILAWFFIALRIWTRTYVLNNFGWDDSTMILAGMIFTLYCASMLYLQANGGGTHITSVTDMVKLTKWTIVGEAAYIITVMTLKISLGVFFSRIVVKTWQLWTIYITVTVNVLSSAASFFYALFRCGANLDIYVYRQLANQCTPRGLDRFFAYQQASVTTLTDCVFAILPVFILWNASMDARTKISVGFILSLGALGSICSVIRFRYVDGLTQIEDFFWNATNIAIWSTIEPGAGIIAGCLATLRPFLKSFVNKARSIRSSTVRSTKEFSKSFRSNDNSSNRKSTTKSYSHQSNVERTHQYDNADLYTQNDQVIELKSDVSKKGESTDCILTQRGDGLWPSRENDSFELDERSSRTNRSRAVSDTCDLDQPLPPIPPDLYRRGDNMV